MSHPYRKSYLKKLEAGVNAEDAPSSSTPARFTLSITANTATLNLTDHKIDRIYRDQLKSALNAALKKGVNVVNLDLRGCSRPDVAIVSTLLTLGRGVKIDVLPQFTDLNPDFQGTNPVIQ